MRQITEYLLSKQNNNHYPQPGDDVDSVKNWLANKYKGIHFIQNGGGEDLRPEPGKYTCAFDNHNKWISVSILPDHHWQRVVLHLNPKHKCRFEYDTSQEYEISFDKAIEMIQKMIENPDKVAKI